MPHLTDDEINAIAKQMADTLTQQRRLQWVDPETHYQHHEWVEQRRQEDERRREFRNKVIQSATIWAVIIACGYAAKTMWIAFVGAIKASGG